MRVPAGSWARALVGVAGRQHVEMGITWERGRAYDLRAKHRAEPPQIAKSKATGDVGSRSAAVRAMKRGNQTRGTPWSKGLRRDDGTVGGKDGRGIGLGVRLNQTAADS